MSDKKPPTEPKNEESKNPFRNGVESYELALEAIQKELGMNKAAARAWLAAREGLHWYGEGGFPASYEEFARRIREAR